MAGVWPGGFQRGRGRGVALSSHDKNLDGKEMSETWGGRERHVRWTWDHGSEMGQRGEVRSGAGVMVGRETICDCMTLTKYNEG